MDFEGVDLCRDGELCIVQLAPLGGDTVLVDICALGERAFGEGRLRELFESEDVLKVYMYICIYIYIYIIGVTTSGQREEWPIATDNVTFVSSAAEPDASRG